MTDCSHKHIKCCDCMRDITAPVYPHLTELEPALLKIQELEQTLKIEEKRNIELQRQNKALIARFDKFSRLAMDAEKVLQYMININPHKPINLEDYPL